MACVDVAAFPLQLLLRDHPDWTAHPAAVVDRDKARGTILWVNSRARATGILPGMRYGAGLALSRHLRAGVISRAAVDEAVAGLVPRLRRFAAEVEPSRDEPGVFWLGASGLALLHPRLEEWAGLIHRDLAGAGLHNTVAVGFTRFGSYAAARASDHPSATGIPNNPSCRSGGHAPARDGDRITVFRTPEEEHNHVRGVRLDRLDFSPRVRDLLARLGIHTLGGFLDLPASQVHARLGREAHRLHRLAAGDLWSPLHPETPSEPAAAGVFLDYPESDRQRLAALMEELLEPLLDALEQRREAMTALLLHLRLDDRSEKAETLRPARPTLDRRQILDLLRLRLEATALTAGVTEIVMELQGVAPDARQGELFHGAAARDHDAANRALARLRARFGDGALVRARPRAGHLPEARFTWEPMETVAPPRPRRVRLRPLVRRFFPRPVRLGNQAPPARAVPDATLEEPNRPVQLGNRAPPAAGGGPYVISGGWWGAGAGADANASASAGADTRTPSAKRELPVLGAGANTSADTSSAGARTSAADGTGAGVHREYHFIRDGAGPWLWVYYDSRRRGWFLHGKVE